MTDIVAGEIVRVDPWKWTEYTPTFNNFNAGTGGTISGRYRNIHREVFLDFYVLFGTSPSFSSTITLNLPFVADSIGIQHHVGGWIFRGSSSSHFSGAIGIWNSAATEASFAGAWNGSTPNDRITTGVPFTVGANDIFSGSLSYIATS